MSTVSSNPINKPALQQAMLQQQPTFIVGAVRSGTTLLRLMLDHHPQLAFHFEFEFAVDQIAADGTFPAVADYHDYLSQHRVFLLSQGAIDLSLDYPALVNSFLEQKRCRDNKAIVGATVHHHIDRIQYLWPEGKYIHLLRDGRDVARSCIAMGWAANMYHAVQRWMDAEQTWQHLRGSIPADRRLEVRYEDLIVQPEQTLTTICEFLGTQFEEAVFDYAENSTYGLPDPQLTDQWRRKLTDHEIRLAESRIADMLVERGYTLSGLPRLELSRLQRRTLARHDWLGRAKFRLQRYGLPLFAADYFARRLPFGSLRHFCRQRVNDIDNLHLR